MRVMVFCVPFMSKAPTMSQVTSAVFSVLDSRPVSVKVRVWQSPGASGPSMTPSGSPPSRSSRISQLASVAPRILSGLQTVIVIRFSQTPGGGGSISRIAAVQANEAGRSSGFIGSGADRA